jgi:hypothetical protein
VTATDGAVTGEDAKAPRRRAGNDLAAPNHGHARRYRLYVASANSVDLAGLAGAWLADRAMAGWDVTGFIADYHDDQLLEILGANTVPYRSASCLWHPSPPHSLAIAPDLYDRDAPLRARLLRAVRLGEPEVIFLGDSCPSEMRGRPLKVEHQCSLGAQAFKRQALSGAGVSTDDVADHEVLFSWPTSRISPVDYASRRRARDVGRRPPEVVPRGWRGITAPLT